MCPRTPHCSCGIHSLETSCPSSPSRSSSYNTPTPCLPQLSWPQTLPSAAKSRKLHLDEETTTLSASPSPPTFFRRSENSSRHWTISPSVKQDKQRYKRAAGRGGGVWAAQVRQGWLKHRQEPQRGWERSISQTGFTCVEVIIWFSQCASHFVKHLFRHLCQISLTQSDSNGLKSTPAKKSPHFRDTSKKQSKSWFFTQAIRKPSRRSYSVNTHVHRVTSLQWTPWLSFDLLQILLLNKAGRSQSQTHLSE